MIKSWCNLEKIDMLVKKINVKLKINYTFIKNNIHYKINIFVKMRIRIGK